MWLLVGLGNVGDKYKGTRHNIGFRVIDCLSEKYFQKLQISAKFQAYCSNVVIDREKVLLTQPTTFMNNSGHSINLIKNYYKILINQIIVVHDDIDLSLGKIKIKLGGHSAGHNGIRSIDSHIGKDYLRVRIGIGRPINKDQIPDYVLNKFSKEENLIMDYSINNAIESIELILKK